MGLIKSSINFGLKIADARAIKKDPERGKNAKFLGFHQLFIQF